MTLNTKLHQVKLVFCGPDQRKQTVDVDRSVSALFELQDLQRDIEQHTESVASVLTLCDVLLHDADACGGDSENDSIQQTTRSLDRRWRNICAMSMERRLKSVHMRT